ncbi:sulfatase [Paracoccaceae bacterium Fryx2]|nr:sulfatase [Paracoccaceae bacterium Fryx2]
MTRAGLALAALLLHLVLVLPNHPGAMTWAALRLFPLELPVILLGLVALRTGGRAVRAGLVAGLTVITVLKVADLAMFSVLNRPFNPLVDGNLVAAGWNVVSGAVGVVPAALAVLAGLAAVPALAAALWWATGRWAGVAPRRVAAALALVAAMVAVADVGQVRRAWALPLEVPGSAFTARLAVERASTYRTMLADLAAFRAATAADPFPAATGLFDRLGGRDLLIVFVESYGRTSIDNPLYAPTHTATLQAGAEKLAGAGLAMRSGWLTSPISGGQSWLAHATLASGLKVSDQSRYGAMLASNRQTLFHLARAAGYRTTAVMPAITLPWPEAVTLGFDATYPAADLGYKGKPFNWVTMPDQFTLAAFDRLPRVGGPQVAQIVLISSHAPWVPVPQMVPWQAVGDGSVFDAMAAAGDPPEVVWRDRDRVREQYRQAIDYSLGVVFDHTARSAAAGRLTIVLGDHPPAAFVSQIDSGDVPVHVIGPPDLVALLDGWGFTPGLMPTANSPVWPMESFRDRLIRALSTSAP